MNALAKADDKLTRDTATCRALLQLTADFFKVLSPVVLERVTSVTCCIGERAEVKVTLFDKERHARETGKGERNDDWGQFDRCTATLTIDDDSIECEMQKWDPNYFGCMGGGYRPFRCTAHHHSAGNIATMLETYFSVRAIRALFDGSGH